MLSFLRFFSFRKKQPLLLLACHIHGSHYCEGVTLFEEKAISVGDKLLLKREPDNRYDAYAIEVFTKKNEKLGYIPKKYNRVIAELLDQHQQVNAEVEAILSTEWEPVLIKLYWVQ